MTQPPPRLPFTNRVTAKGRPYWFFRSKDTGLIRLEGEPGTAKFLLAYGNALALRERIRGGTPAPADQASLAALVDAYLVSAEFRALADSTQSDYRRTCQLLKGELGDQPFRYITRAMVKAVRDDHAGQARKANKVTQMASRLYSWGEEAGLVPDGCNPAAGLKKLKRKGGVREYVPWSDQEIAWAIAAAEPHELTPLLIFLYTGQRCADVAAMPWICWQGDLVRCRSAKTGALIDLPCHPVLKAHLEALRAGARVIQLTGPICLSRAGRPMNSGALGGVIRRLVERCPRIPNNRGPHGIRYAAAARMEEGGATVAAIESVLGHRTFRMALKYASGRLRAAQGVAAMKGSNDG